MILRPSVWFSDLNPVHSENGFESFRFLKVRCTCLFSFSKACKFDVWLVHISHYVGICAHANMACESMRKLRYTCMHCMKRYRSGWITFAIKIVCQHIYNHKNRIIAINSFFSANFINWKGDTHLDNSVWYEHFFSLSHQTYVYFLVHLQFIGNNFQLIYHDLGEFRNNSSVLLYSYSIKTLH